MLDRGFNPGRFHSPVRSRKVKAIALSDKIFSDRSSYNRYGYSNLFFEKSQ
ncbi:hypothetical protein [Kamptonema formosum]